MGLFSRKNRTTTTEVTPEAEEAPAAVPAIGPLDYSQAGDVSKLVDFGSILVPPTVGLQIMPEVDPQTGRVGSLTFQFGQAAVQTLLSSAPKSTGLWDEVREELVKDLQKQGATITEREGEYGPEILAQVPAATAGGQRGQVQMRFVGIDGPNWFMRLVFNNAPEDSADYQHLREVLQQLVIRRDATPRPPREVLPLSLPQAEPAQQA